MTVTTDRPMSHRTAVHDYSVNVAYIFIFTVKPAWIALRTD